MKMLGCIVMLSIFLVVTLVSFPYASAQTLDTNHQCQGHRYHNFCDLIKPSLTIASPANHAVLTTHTITITGAASDGQSGLRAVAVAVDGSGFTIVPTVGGIWSYTTTLSSGPHIVKAKDVDWAHNINNAHVVIKIR